MSRRVLLGMLLLVSVVLPVSCGKKENGGATEENLTGNAGVVEYSTAPQNTVAKAVKNNVYLEDEDVSGLSEKEALARVEQYGIKAAVEAKNAQLDWNKWVIASPEQVGRKVNVKKTLEKLMNASEGSRVTLEYDYIQPGITSQGLMGNIVEIASFTTPVLDKQESRLNNIFVASGKMDYCKLAPGQEFSFNGILGKRTEAKGYEEAPVIIKTEKGTGKGQEIGGGICQLSTTIYNAAEMGGMTITERHIHSDDVGYVAQGKDATVSYGSVDLKFVNSRNYPVMLRVIPSKNELTVKILENRN